MITDSVTSQPQQEVGACSSVGQTSIGHAQALSLPRATCAVTLVLGFNRTPGQAVLYGPTGARLLAQSPLNHFKILLGELKASKRL